MNITDHEFNDNDNDWRDVLVRFTRRVASQRNRSRGATRGRGNNRALGPANDFFLERQNDEPAEEVYDEPIGGVRRPGGASRGRGRPRGRGIATAGFGLASFHRAQQNVDLEDLEAPPGNVGPIRRGGATAATRSRGRTRGRGRSRGGWLLTADDDYGDENEELANPEALLNQPGGSGRGVAMAPRGPTSRQQIQGVGRGARGPIVGGHANGAVGDNRRVQRGADAAQMRGSGQVDSSLRRVSDGRVQPRLVQRRMINVRRGLISGID